MKLDNKHLLLGDRDADWHRPLAVSTKNEEASNKRKRSEEPKWNRRYREQCFAGKASQSSLKKKFQTGTPKVPVRLIDGPQAIDLPCPYPRNSCN